MCDRLPLVRLRIGCLTRHLVMQRVAVVAQTPQAVYRKIRRRFCLAVLIAASMPSATSRRRRGSTLVSSGDRKSMQSSGPRCGFKARNFLLCAGLKGLAMCSGVQPATDYKRILQRISSITTLAARARSPMPGATRALAFPRSSRGSPRDLLSPAAIMIRRQRYASANHHRRQSTK